jgi:hypothetical protein
METRIQFDRLGIAEAIKRNRLKVPLNQREYAWETEHVHDLLTDLASSMQKQREVYFLGTLVLTTSPQGFLEVADGQQRLATTTLILAAFRDIFLELKDDIRAQSLEGDFLFTIDISQRERIPKLALNADDNEFFGSKILARPAERKSEITAKRTSHHLLQDAFKEIKEYFGGLRSQVGEANYSDSLLRWVKFLTDGATIITLIVPDDLDAFVMFETLNDRGLKTSQADLVKNHLFKEAGDRRSEAQVSWSSMRGAIESIGEEDLTIDFLRHVCNLLYGQTRERDVFEAIKTANRGAGECIRFLSLLGELAQDYAAILNPDHPKWNPYPPDIRASVRTLNLLNVAQIRPLLIGAARHLNEKTTAQAFERFVAWCVRFIVCGGARGGDLERKYCDMGNAVHTGKIKNITELDAAAKTVVPTDGQFQAAFATARVNVAKLARYMLRCLERSASNEPNPEWVVNEAVVINLEHVMPSAAEPEEWPNVSPQDIEAYANRLGNLVLLQADVNQKLDRHDFATKRVAYAQSTFLLTSQVGEQLAWGVPEIEARQRTLAKLAVKTWKIG